MARVPLRTARKGCKLTGQAASGTDDGGTLYDAALGFWDRLIEEAAKRGLELRDRLDAQSVTWCVTKCDPKPDWPEEQQQAFLAYRNGEPPVGGTGGTTGSTGLGGQVDEGEVAVSDIYSFIRSRGYRFPDWLVTDYLISLATKPFVLLCGISGTGKTKLAQLVAEYLAPPETRHGGRGRGTPEVRSRLVRGPCRPSRHCATAHNRASAGRRAVS